MAISLVSPGIKITETDFVSTSLIEKEPDTKGKLIRQEQQDGTIKYSHQQGDTTSEIDEDAYNQMSAALSPDEDGNYVIPGKIKTDEDNPVAGLLLRFSAQ